MVPRREWCANASVKGRRSGAQNFPDYRPPPNQLKIELMKI
jgi:hypothetical protein